MPELEEQEGILVERPHVVRRKVTYGRTSAAADTSIAQSSSPSAIFDSNSSPTRTRRSTGESNAADTSYTTAGSDSDDKSPVKLPSLRAARTLTRIVSESVKESASEDEEIDEIEQEEDDGEALLARVRARMQAANASASSPAEPGSVISGPAEAIISSDLSSVPPTSSLAAAPHNSSASKSSSSALPPIDRLAGRMRAKQGRFINRNISLSSSSAEEEDDQSIRSPSPHKRKSTGGSNKTLNDTLGSAPTDSHEESVSESSDIDLSTLQNSQHRKAERHSKLGQLAERRRQDQAKASQRKEALTPAEAPVELEGEDSSVIASSDDEEEDLPAPMAALVTAAGDVLAANKQKEAAEAAAKQARKVAKAAKAASLSTSAKAKKDKHSDKRRSKPRPLTKKELATMEQEAARIKRQEISRKQTVWHVENYAKPAKYGVMRFIEEISGSDMVRNVAPSLKSAAPAAAPFAESMEEIANGSSPQVAHHMTSSGFPTFERPSLRFDAPSTSTRPTLAATPAPRSTAAQASSSKVIAQAFGDSDEDELPDMGDAFAGLIAKREEKDKAKLLSEKKARIVAAMAEAARKTTSAAKAGKNSIDDDDLEIMVAPRKPAARPMQMDKPVSKPLTPGAKGVRRSNPFSSPGGAEDPVSVSQLRVAAIAFRPAEHTKASPRTAQHRFSPTVEDGTEVKPKAAAAHAPSRRPNPHITQNQLNAKLREQMQVQNLRTREKRLAEAGARAQQPVVQPDAQPEDLQAKLARLAETAKLRGARLLGDANDQEEARDSGEDEASVPDDEKYDHLDLGSGDEELVEAAGSGSEEEEENAEPNAAQEDSDKENSQPAGSQVSSNARPSLLDDDEEAQLVVPAAARRNRHSRAVLSDDDDDEDQPLAPVQLGQRTPLRPLRTDSRATDTDSPPMPPMDDDYDLPPLDDESGSPVAIAAFGGEGGLTQFFQDTQDPTDEARKSPRSISHNESQAAPASEPPSTFGQFFEGTQVDAPLRGESLDILARTGRVSSTANAAGPAGLTQLFADATPPRTGLRRLPSAMPPPMKSAAGAATVPDAFAALRRAQAEESLEPSPSMLPSLSLSGQMDDEHEARLEAAAERMRLEQLAANRKPQQQYLNNKGFFTQTKPGVGEPSHDSQSQSQGPTWSAYDASPARPGLESSMSTDAPHSELGSEAAPSPVMRRARFRRALAKASDSEEESDKVLASPKRKRSASPVEATSEDDGDASEADEVVPLKKTAPQPQKPSNAFSVLMAPKPREQPPRKPTSAFVEGEAEESDEEELALGKRRGHGGLRGVFSDEEGSADEADEDEEDDGKDLEGLVNDEREQDEAAKDKLAQEAFLAQREQDEEAHLAQAQKIVAGEARNKRRDRDGDLNALLDDDYDDENMLRKAQGPKFKKRKVDGDDKLDALGEQEESKAFVELYKNAVQTNDEIYQHDNLLAPDDDSSSDDDDDEDRDDDRRSEVRNTITQKQHREELRQARKRKRAAVADDDEEERRSEEPEVRKKSWYDVSDGEGSDSDDNIPRQLQSRNPLCKPKPKASIPTARTVFRSHGGDSDDDHTLAMNPSSNLLSRGFATNKSSSNSERLQQFAQDHKDSSLSNARRAASGSSSSITAMSAREAKRPETSRSGLGSDASAKGPSSMRKSSSSMLVGVKSVMGRRVEESQ